MFRLIRHPNTENPNRYDVGLFMPREEVTALTDALRARQGKKNASLEEMYTAKPHFMFDILNWAANQGQPYPGQDAEQLHWLSCIGVVEKPCPETSVNFHVGIIPEGYDMDVALGQNVSWSEVVASLAETVVACTLQRPKVEAVLDQQRESGYQV